MESTQLEYKREYTDSILKSIIAFANSEGGTILIGIDDDGTVVGVTETDALMLKIASKIKDSIHPDMVRLCSISAVLKDEKILVQIIVATGINCPYYLKSKGPVPSGTYTRLGASNQQMSEPDIVAMIGRFARNRYEELLSTEENLTFSYLKEFLRQNDLPWNPVNLRLQQTTGEYTNLGMILSDQNPYQLKIAVFQNDTADVFLNKMELQGSLLKQVNEAFDIVNRYNRTSARIEGLQRKETRDYPPISLREAIVNAAVHRDYSLSAPIIINVFSEQIEIVSGGGLMKGMTLDDGKNKLSIARNENLARFFLRIGYVEAFGTGIGKIFKAYDKQEKKPEFFTAPNSVRVVLPCLES